MFLLRFTRFVHDLDEDQELFGVIGVGVIYTAHPAPQAHVGTVAAPYSVKQTARAKAWRSKPLP
jgi:hypothetical protein